MAPAASSKTYDFVIVGAGPAGCVLASRLAETPQRPSVLLLEAGGANDDVNKRMLTHKTLNIFDPEMNWGDKAEPNPQLDDRACDLPHGRGLGGSTAINFTVWMESTKVDWDRMAKDVGDDTWRWERVKERFNELTTHHCKYPDVRPEFQNYVGQQEGNYGVDGPLHVGYPEEMERDMLRVAQMLDDCGIPFRSDPNSGSLAGTYSFPETVWRGARSTAADLLDDHPDNLEIGLGAHIARVVVEGDRAVGVEALDGRVFRASREVILSAGAMDSPRILMHSGIGPEDQLSQFGIPIKRANANVGQNLQDHIFLNMGYHTDETLMKRHTFFKDESAKKAALRAWQRRRTGPYASLNGTFIIAMQRPEQVLAAPEFAALPEEEKQHLRQTDTPLCELAFGLVPFGYLLDPHNTPATFSTSVILQHLQGRGSCQLKSADPSEPLAFHTGWFSNEFDRRHALESMRCLLALLRKGEFPRHAGAPLRAPASDSEEDIMRFWRQNAGTCFHSSSTCKMGRREIEDAAVVDTEFRVHGFANLRVVDNSILPRCLPGHIQSAAYQVGMVAAEKLSAEHRLN